MDNQRCSKCVNYIKISNLNNETVIFVCAKQCDIELSEGCTTFDIGSYNVEENEVAKYICGANKFSKIERRFYDYYEGAWRF